MRKRLVFIITIAIFIFVFVMLGLILASLIPLDGTICTERGCPCGYMMGGQLQESKNGELPCNGCTTYKFLFLTGIINIQKNCGATEIVICDNGVDAGSRIDINYEDCKNELSFFKISPLI